MWDLTIHTLQGPMSSLTLVPFYNRCGTPQSTPPSGPTSLLTHRLLSTLFRGLASSLAQCSVSGSDTVCNGPSPPLADIVLFGLSLSCFHTLIKNVSFSSPIKVGSRPHCFLTFLQDDELRILDVRKFKPVHKRKFNYEVMLIYNNQR